MVAKHLDEQFVVSLPHGSGAQGIGEIANGNVGNDIDLWEKGTPKMWREIKLVRCQQDV